MKTQTNQDALKNNKVKQGHKTKTGVKVIPDHLGGLKSKKTQVNVEKEALKGHLQKQNGEKKIDQVLRMLELSEEQPRQAIRQLIRLYKDSPYLYHQRGKDQYSRKNDGVRLIFIFVYKMVNSYEDLSFTDRDLTVKMFQDFYKYFHEDREILLEEELCLIQKTSQLLWKKNKNRGIDNILDSGIKYFGKIAVLLIRAERSNDQQNVGQQIVKRNMREMIRTLERTQQQNSQYKSLLYNFSQQILECLSETSLDSRCILPLFDIAAFSLTSVHSEYYGKLLILMFEYLKHCLELMNEDNVRNESETLKESQTAMKFIFLACNLFRLNSVFDSQGGEGKPFHSREVIFLVLHIYKKNLMKLIEELQRIRRNCVPVEIIRDMFKMSIIGKGINKETYIKEIISKILEVAGWRKQLIKVNQGTVASEEEHIHNLVVAHEKSLFQLLYRIEKMLTNFDLQIYMDLYIDHPNTFESQYFIESMFKNQHIDTLLNFMIKFTRRWILDQSKLFDPLYIFMQFLKKCVSSDTLQTLGKYLKELEVAELLKVNDIIFNLSFQEDKKKYSIPDSLQRQYQLAHLTSAGYADKFQLINKIFTNFSEQMVWKEIINSIYPSPHYIYVKAFYNVINFQFDFSSENMIKINKIIGIFSNEATRQSVEIYSIFHLLRCIFFKSERFQTLERVEMERQLFQILMGRADRLIKMSSEICDRRGNAMNYVALTKTMVNDNLRYFEKIKKMHIYFLKEVVRWMQSLQNIDRIINRSRAFEDVIQFREKFAQEVECGEFHLRRTLSHYCSSNYFANTLQMKIQNKMINFQLMNMTNFLHLRQMMYLFIGKYRSESLSDQYCVKEIQILRYYDMLLGVKLQVTNQRDVLKQKVIVLDQLHEIISFSRSHPQNEIVNEFSKLFHQSIKHSIISIAAQNPQLVSKYERDLILHLRTMAIKQIILLYQTPFQIMDKKDLYGFVMELCFDKMVEIRMFLLNIMISRFKSTEFELFIADKYRLTSFLTMFTIFQPSPFLKTTAATVIQTIKNQGDDDLSLGLMTFLYCNKFILSEVFNGIQKDQICIYSDTFLKVFDELWLGKKEWEYTILYLLQLFLDENRIGFPSSGLSFRSYVQRYIITREKTDFLLESEIKDYLKGQFSFEMPPDQQELNINQSAIKDIMGSLPYRMLKKLRQLLSLKKRSSRIIKGRRDISVNWRYMKQQELILVYQGSTNKEKVELSLP